MIPDVLDEDVRQGRNGFPGWRWRWWCEGAESSIPTTDELFEFTERAWGPDLLKGLTSDTVFPYHGEEPAAPEAFKRLNEAEVRRINAEERVVQRRREEARLAQRRKRDLALEDALEIRKQRADIRKQRDAEMVARWERQPLQREITPLARTQAERDEYEWRDRACAAAERAALEQKKTAKLAAQASEAQLKAQQAYWFSICAGIGTHDFAPSWPFNDGLTCNRCGARHRTKVP